MPKSVLCFLCADRDVIVRAAQIGADERLLRDAGCVPEQRIKIAGHDEIAGLIRADAEGFVFAVRAAAMQIHDVLLVLIYIFIDIFIIIEN